MTRNAKLLTLTLLAAGISLACSDDPAHSPDTGPASDGPLVADGAPGSDAPSAASCLPSKALLAKVDPKRMLADLKFLTELKERRTHASQKKAADYLRSQLAKLSGVTLRDHSYIYQGQGYVNLELTIAGSDKKDELVLMGAHFDSNSNHATQAPGADDNASGAAAVTEVARVLAGCKPRRGVRLLLFSNEEKGTIGSKAYVKQLKAVLPASRMKGFINVDMIAYGPDDEDLDLATRTAYASLAKSMAKAVEQHTTLKTKTIVSDHCG